MTEAHSDFTTNQLNPHQELRQLVCSQLKLLLEQKNWEGAKAILVPVQPVDIAEAIEELPEPMQAIAFRLLAKDEAITVYEYLDVSVQQVLLEDFTREDVLEIIDKMSPDDRAKLFDELPAKVVRNLLIHLSHQQREATAMLLGYQPDTAGRIMTPEYISLKQDWTVAATFELIRRVAPDKETIYSLYVTDQVHHLTGHLSLRSLVAANEEQTIGEIMNPHIISVHTNTHQKKVADLIQRYDFIALPVVDGENRLVGIVTVDDAIDILEAETTKDIHTIIGIQSGENNYFQTKLYNIVRRRALWLTVVFIITTLASVIIQAQEQLLKQAIVLIAFIPLLIDTGGDVGSQSSTVVIRGLNVQDLNSRNFWRIVKREALVGVLLGVALGLGTIVWAYLLQGNLLIAMVVGISMLLISVLSSTTGAMLPFLFSVMGLDPALMSTPFITTIADVFGVLIYLYVAQLVLKF